MKTAPVHPPSPAAPAAEIWDLPLRLFHWSLVAVVAIAGLSGFLAPEWWLDIHVVAGYALGALLAFRVLWGFFGSRYSRFRSFPLAPGAALEHLRAVAARRAPDRAGHNAAASWMIVVLLGVLGVLVASGVLALGGQENQGPLAPWVGFPAGVAALDVHRIAAWALLGAVVLHLGGVFVEAAVLRHPVIAAMVSGRKRGLAGNFPPIAPGYRRRGAVLFAASAGALIAGGAVLEALPAARPQPGRAPAAYEAECAACHVSYHPSLRSAASWSRMMSGLGEHYGEDASLDDGTRRRIAAYLSANAAEAFDTEPAWQIGRRETASLRITDTDYWKARHAGLPDDIFRSRAVGAKLNCNACHRDAQSGMFADQRIALPTGDSK